MTSLFLPSLPAAVLRHTETPVCTGQTAVRPGWWEAEDRERVRHSVYSTWDCERPTAPSPRVPDSRLHPSWGHRGPRTRGRTGQAPAAGAGVGAPESPAGARSLRHRTPLQALAPPCQPRAPPQPGWSPLTQAGLSPRSQQLGGGAPTGQTRDWGSDTVAMCQGQGGPGWAVTRPGTSVVATVAVTSSKRHVVRLLLPGEVVTSPERVTWA